jgi:hypothetical protein
MRMEGCLLDMTGPVGESVKMGAGHSKACAAKVKRVVT